MLHLTAYKQYNLVQQLRNSADDVRLGEHSEETNPLTNEELKELELEPPNLQYELEMF